MHQETDIALYEKFGCPPLNLSFIDSQRRRLCFRNERALYTRTCDATGETIISIYSPDKPFKIYKSDYWYGDNWDPLAYGQDFDVSKSFFEQFAELDRKVPRLALLNINAINSDYCNMTVGNKNCYLIFGGDFNQDCMYGTLCMKNVSCLDLDYSHGNSFCYELSDSINCYECQYAFDSKNCTNCYYVNDCADCAECILCTSLSQKSYCIENKQYTKEEYFEKKKELINGNAAQSKKLFEAFLQLRAKRHVKFSHIINCQNCTGDHLKNAKNCSNCFDTSDSEDLKNVLLGIGAKDCFEASFVGHNSEHCFNMISATGTYSCICSFFIFESADIEYSKYIISSKNTFGCVGLRHKQYCILNKQYTEEEYKNLRQRIIDHMKQTGEWGQFFPSTLSDFAFNETSAYDYFPLTKEEATAQGYTWKDEDRKTTNHSTELLTCENCKKHYKILSQELVFYRKFSIPVPRICDNCRHKRRMQLKNPRQLWTRTCQKCGIDLQSSYGPDRAEIVYCEQCYLQEVY